MLHCNCSECNGTGKIKCPECAGAGGTHGNIETIKLEKSMTNYDELVALQKDARRARRQTEKLKELNPERAGSYTEQLITTLAAIEKLADKASKKK